MSNAGKVNTLLDAALAYAGLGWRVLPLHNLTGENACTCKTGATCQSAGKHPCILKWSRAASADPAVIRRWWTTWPAANVGVLCGQESGIFDLECEEEGIADLAALQEANGPLPRTPQALSGNGGLHHIFRWPGDGRIVSTGQKVEKRAIDTLGRGGQFVAPPSCNKGGPYRWVGSPFDVQPAEAPEWLLEWLRENGRLEGGPHTGNGKADFWRMRTPRSYSVEERAVLYLQRCPPAVSGQGGHGQTFSVARAVVYGFDLGIERGLRLLLEHYNPRCQPEWLEKELQHKCEEAERRPFSKPRGYLIGADRTCPAPGASHGGGDRRPVIRITVEEHEVVRQVTAALAADPLLFQRDGQVVTPRLTGVDDATDPKAEGRGLQVQRPRNAVSLVAASPAFVRLAVTEHCRLVRGLGKKEVRAEPPKWLTPGVLARPGGIRPLDGLLLGPTLRPDGALINSCGYDGQTRLYLGRPLPGLCLAESPGLDDARAAVQAIRGLVADFPWKAEADFLRWVLLLLTAAARHMTGLTPLGLLTANTAGSGKTKLARLISLIAHGTEAPILITWPDGARLQQRGEEVRKLLSSLLQEGATLVLIDNLPRGAELSSPELDAFITSPAFYARLLGHNDGQRSGGANRCLLLATGNAVQPSGDTSDRALSVNLCSPLPNPRSRPQEDFRFPDLLGHAARERAALLGAVLTVWRAWTRAGQPRPGGEPWGSFEQWVDTAVSAVRWACDADPLAGRAREAEAEDREGEALRALMSLWSAVLPAGWLAAGEVINGLASGLDAATPGGQRKARLRDALSALCPGRKDDRPLTREAVGRCLKRYTDRVVEYQADDGGHRAAKIVRQEDRHDKVSQYQVIDVPCGGAGVCGGCCQPPRTGAHTHTRAQERADSTSPPQTPAPPQAGAVPEEGDEDPARYSRSVFDA
jgi:hypothetical protein